MEAWLPIDGYPNYAVSSNGRIKNIKTGRILKQNNNSHGYPSVSLFNSNGQKNMKVHRLVAETFYDCDCDGLDVNHIDGDKRNNFVGNLEWCTRRENVQHAFDTGLKTPSRQVPIRIIETGEVFNSIRECARHIGGDHSAIRRCLMGIEGSCKGYTFEYIK